MDDDELRRSAALEQRHWWYAGRRALVRRLMRGVPAGRAVDVGPGPGGNAAVLRDLGWQVTGVELTEVGRPAVRRARAGRRPRRRDAAAGGRRERRPGACPRTSGSTSRTTRRSPGSRSGCCGPEAGCWSPSPRARTCGAATTSRSATSVATSARSCSTWWSRTASSVHDIASWNVLLRPVAKLRRARTAGPDADASEMEHVAAPVNAGLRAAIAVESLLPVGRLPGLSLVVRAYRP